MPLIHYHASPFLPHTAQYYRRAREREDASACGGKKEAVLRCYGITNHTLRIANVQRKREKRKEKGKRKKEMKERTWLTKEMLISYSIWSDRLRKFYVFIKHGYDVRENKGTGVKKTGQSGWMAGERENKIH